MLSQKTAPQQKKDSGQPIYGWTFHIILFAGALIATINMAPFNLKGHDLSAVNMSCAGEFRANSSFSWPDFLEEIFIGAKTGGPAYLIARELPGFSAVIARERMKTKLMLAVLAARKKRTPKSIPPPAEAKPVMAKTLEPKVLIIHTHTSECYIPLSGVKHRLNEKGDIVKAGSLLASILENEYHVPVLHIAEIHDQVPFREAYMRAENTIQRALQEHPDLSLILDIHRDGNEKTPSFLEINKQRMAPLMIVVGTDHLGLPHPRWKENLAFSQKIAEHIRSYNKSLLLRLIQAKARYNQHLHPRSLIIEIGNHLSSWEEIQKTVEVLAKTIADMLDETPPLELKPQNHPKLEKI
ncbi:MAG: stage II sporulation protein P [Bacillota bacterium]